MTAEAGPSYPLLGKRHSVDIFVCTIVISVILHIAASTLLLLPGRYSARSSAPLYVDLQSLAAPAAEAPPESPVEEPVMSQPEPLAETTPEVAKLESAIESSVRKAAVKPEAIHESSIGLGMVSGHFASFAEGESLKDDIRVYYFELMRRINEYWWTNGGARGNFNYAASVNIVISREGKVIACDLFESSGRREQDQALLEAIKKAEPLPPLPQSFPQRTFNAPIRFVPPLRLMFPGFGKKSAAPH